MVGGWNKRDDGASAISSTNIFAALKSSRTKSNKKASDSTVAQARVPTQVRPVTSWADCEDDDDDYFAMQALPPLPSLDDDRAQAGVEEEDEDADDDDEVESIHGEGSEGYDEVEEGNEENKEPESYKANKLGTDVKVHIAAREPDRQLSKKDLKKKELAELEAALVELGLNRNFEKVTLFFCA
ncbi:hypothetical protein GOP47_0016516 [Adiantum capillus-veneris]|uniref:Uncharacterized protein n=1 Tax=Adiantum capillus-veneris TaxID=13818 RepID=A0A9D4ZD21_ADICA|nr:hypothetical protein GOP47_0016516 [Adiantum capillus-veneris]